MSRRKNIRFMMGGKNRIESFQINYLSNAEKVEDGIAIRAMPNVAAKISVDLTFPFQYRVMADSHLF